MPSTIHLANYRDIGTNIDVTASAAPGRYRIAVTLEESSVYPSERRCQSDSMIAGCLTPSARCEPITM